MSLDDLRRFYDSELGRNGWSFLREATLSSVRVACYEKAGDLASLQIATDSSPGWSYAFDLVWGTTCP